MQLLTESHTPVIEDARDVIWPYLAEGVFDPYILKAIFFGGGMGSGKSYVIGQMAGILPHHSLTGLGLRVVGVDDIFMRDVARAGLDPKTVLQTQRGKEMHMAARGTRTRRQKLFLRGRLGLILDGTGQNPTSVHKKKAMLESLGYDCSMVMVDAPIDVALARNACRPRSVPDPLVRENHRVVRKAMEIYRASFGSRYHQIPSTAKPDKNCDYVKLSKQENRALAKKFHKLVLRISAEPLKNPKGWAWLRSETEGMPKSMLKKVTWLGKKRGA